MWILVAAVGEEHHPKISPKGCRTGGNGFFGGYPGADFIQVEFLVVAVNQADGEAVGGSVDGVVGVHVACGALPLVGDGEGDGVVGDEEGADVGGVGDGGGVGDEAELHQGGVSTEVGTINVEREGVGHFGQPGGGDGGAAAFAVARTQIGVEVGSLDNGFVVNAILAEVPSVDIAVIGLAVGIPLLIEQHITVALCHTLEHDADKESQ